MRRSLIGTASVALIALGLCALSIRTGIASYYREDDPVLALAVASDDARAAMFEGEALVLKQQPPDLAQAALFGRRALLRDTTLATPYRMIGFEKDAKGDHTSAERLIAYAARLSPRDLAAQLWLINRDVARDDVTGALQRFDTALRATSLATPLLMPILSQALAEPRIVDSLAPRLVRAPWSAEFLTQAIATSKALPGLVRLAGQLERLGTPLGPDNMRQLVNRLVEAREYELVGLIRPITSGQLPHGQFLNDPTFDQPGTIPSFEWTLGTTDAVEVTRGSEGKGGRGMSFEGHPGAVGEIARQLLTLAPGHYRLTTAGSSNATTEEYTPRWFITCANRGETRATIAMASLGPVRTSATEFDIPDHCVGQWLVLTLRPSSRPVQGTVDAVRIERR